MSRRIITARQPGVAVVVGWDNPLSTFFAQATLIQDDPEDHPILFWIGGIFGQVTSAGRLAEHIAPYADLSNADIEQLRNDRAACLDRGPTALRRLARALATGGMETENDTQRHITAREAPIGPD